LVRNTSAGKYNIKEAFSSFIMDSDKSRQMASSSNEVYPDSCTTHFAAANVDQKSNKRDITGLFSLSCARHDIPLKFSNMFHGERYIYPKMVLEEVGITPANKRHADGTLVLIGGLGTTYIFYDIGCKFGKSFGDTGFKYCVPKMHAYAHQGECFRRFHPSFVEGVGCCDGEGCERIWKALSPFVYMTRNMLAANRAEQLEDIILHIFRGKSAKLIKSLKLKVKKATQKLEQAEVAFLAFGFSKEDACFLFNQEKLGNVSFSSMFFLM
jgi:hypothetical protein